MSSARPLERTVPAPATSRSGLRWLFVAFAFHLVANGGWIVPLAPWLVSPFLLRFTRSRRPLSGFLLGWLALAVGGALHWRGLIPAPGARYLAIVAMMQLPVLAACMVDRVLARRIPGFAGTLVFPAAWVTAQLLASRSSPYGSWGSVAYTQADDLPLLQLISVTGMWGVSFLVAWSGAVVVWAWERGFEWRRVRGGVLTLAGVLAVVLLAGGARLLRPIPGETVRVASFTVTPDPPLPLGDLLSRPRQGPAREALRARLGAIADTLFVWADREARAGARVVLWSEANLPVLREDEPALLRRGAGFALDRHVTLGLAYASFEPGQGWYENELALFGPDGAPLARYHKARPVPGDRERGADRHLPVVETPVGRIAGAICFDGDFPDLIRESGRARADLLLVPSSDWRAIDPIHTRMAVLRAIENGCSIVRQTNKGLSAAADAHGRIRAWVDFFHTRPCVMVSQVPARGVRTLYARWGNGFALLCVVALLGLTVLAWIRGRSTGGSAG